MCFKFSFIDTIHQINEQICFKRMYCKYTQFFKKELHFILSHKAHFIFEIQLIYVFYSYFAGLMPNVKQSIRQHGTSTANHGTSNHIRVVEVGPRDGLQNEPKFVETDVKIEFINRLSKVGLSNIEVTAYVCCLNCSYHFVGSQISRLKMFFHIFKQFCQPKMDTTIQR